MFVQIVFGSGFINFLIWFLLFLTSTAALALIIRLARDLRRRNFTDPQLVGGVRDACDRDDLDGAYALTAPGGNLFARTLNAVFRDFRLGPEGRDQAAEGVVSQHGGVLLRRINTLALCGNIAPMLGLLGTVTGMVSAFMGLGSAMGPEKASVLAISISQALYTTAAGLLIAVPAITASVIARNRLEERTGEVSESVNELLNSFLEQ